MSRVGGAAGDAGKTPETSRRAREGGELPAVGERFVRSPSVSLC